MKTPRVPHALLAFACLAFSNVGAQTFFNDADGADSDWSTAGNWSVGEPTAADDAFVNDGLTAEITQAGEAARILFLGDARNGPTTNNGTLDMTGGDLDVDSLRIGTDSDGGGGTTSFTTEGIFNFIDGAITASNAGAGEAVQIGSTNFNAATLTSIIGRMNMGDGTTAPTLDYSGGRFEVGTGNGAIAFFNFLSGTITGNQNLIIGQGNADSESTAVIGGFATPASFTTTTDMNWNDGMGDVTIDDNGSVSCRTLNFSNLAGETSTLTINTGGSMTVSQNMNDRAGSATVNVNGGTLSFSSTTDRSRNVDFLNLGQGGTGSTIGIILGTDPIDVLAGATMEGGTHTISVDGLASSENANNAGQFNVNLQDTYVAATGNWDTDANWSLGTDPGGEIAIGDSVNVVTANGTIPGAAAATLASSDANWTPVLRTRNAADDTLALEAVAAASFGPLRAVIPGASVTRDSGDLRIYRGLGADAQQLNMTGGSLTVTAGNELIIGGPQLVDVGNGIPNNNGSFVTQTSGNVTLEGNLRYGPATFAPGDEGGVYNLDGGTLAVMGDIIETDPGVDNAQFFIDGGILDFQGTNITVQSFRTGDTSGTTGDFTLEAGKTLTTTGTFVAGTQGTGTFTAEAGSTLVFGTASGTPFILGDNANGDGTFVSNGATITSSGVVLIADRATGTATFNAGTTWTNTAGDFRIAAGDGVSGQDQGGTGVLNLNGDATIIQSGGNFEVADFGDANLDDNVSRPDGTLNMNGATSRIIVGSNNFILGQQADTIATVHRSGGTIDVTTTDGTTPRATSGDFNINAGDGTMDMTGGTCRVRTWNLSNNADGSADLTISGGTFETELDVNYRGNGSDSLFLGGEATLAVGRDFIVNNPTTNNAGTPFNEIAVSGSAVTFTIGDEFRADADTRVRFLMDPTGVSSIDASGTVTLNDATLEVDFAGLAAASALDIPRIDLITGPTVVGGFVNIAFGDPVPGTGFADASTYLLQVDATGVYLEAAGSEDSDRDGISNFLEEAFGTDPLDPNSGPEGLPTVSSDGNNVTITYRQLETPGMILYDVEVSTNLVNWTFAPSALAGDQGGAPPGIDLYEATLPIGPEEELFLRVSVIEDN